VGVVPPLPPEGEAPPLPLLPPVASVPPVAPPEPPGRFAEEEQAPAMTQASSQGSREGPERWCESIAYTGDGPALM
jgi:type IV secretory pathway VirB10-like protein